ncbi:molybdopterin cofactor-binding domain-containing protein [Larkinella sp. GY13]|uniref:xanthine dehydrogenase family protein molybdopterin-binding subunit n=1 Tax=Larkinella sp. GY13 TaxID=3453720 RepID=UPI003EEBA7AD
MNTIHKSTNRRVFVKQTLFSGVALMLGFSLSGTAQAGTDEPGKKPGLVATNVSELTVFIRIDQTGKITLINPHPEMGQGTYQAIALLLAEELEVRLDQVTIQFSDGSQKYGYQLAGGSSSVSSSWEPMRKAGAAAKEMLLTVAAQRWQVPVTECYAREGTVHCRTKLGLRPFPYGELVKDAARLDIPEEPKLKRKEDFTLIGKATHRPDVRPKVTGKAVFGIDATVPGMRYAAIEHAPTIYGTVESLEATNALRIKGVRKVLIAERPMLHARPAAVAVLADSYAAALQGRKALVVKWQDADSSSESTADYFSGLYELAKSEGVVYQQDGDFETALATAPRQLEAQYETPFLAHAPMEPETAVAHVQGDRCEIWAPVQAPDWAVREIAAYLQIPPEHVKVNVLFSGGAFGRKAYYDYLLEAVYLSKQVSAPVKVIWTREDDLQQGPFRPGVLNTLKAGLNSAGKVVAFQHKVATASIRHQSGFEGGLPETQADDWARGDGIYHFPNSKYSFQLAKTRIPIVWWRAVYASNINFAYESFVDELAVAAGKDPLTFRSGLLADDHRAQQVLTLLAEKSGWHKPLPVGKGRGMAITRFADSYCAHVCVVARKTASVVIENVISVIDCGLAINPDNVRAQTEGNIIMGLTVAIKKGITIEQGRVQQSNFHDYPVLRISEIPTIEVFVIGTTGQPTGVGETALPPMAPALTNAVFNLTGRRIRKLPFALDEMFNP